MAERWFVASGNWVAANFNGGTLPAADDDVFANGFAATINTSITVKSLSTRAGSTAVAGGSFTTSGTVTVTADSYAGSTNCLTLNANAIQNGNSFGSTTTNSTSATIVEYQAVQNGNATGGSGFIRLGSTVRNGGVLNGDTTGGTVSSLASGAVLSFNARQNGNANASDAAPGTILQTRSILNGNSYGHATAGVVGCDASGGSIHIGNSFGGGGVNAHGTRLSGCIQIGNSTGGSGASSIGTIATNGSIQQGTQTGNTSTSSSFGTLSQSGSIVITTGITNNTASGLRIENGTAVILQNGVTSGQVSTTGATVGRYAIGASLPEYPFIGGGLAGFPLSRIVN
jgi:hypothetical protein